MSKRHTVLPLVARHSQLVIFYALSVELSVSLDSIGNASSEYLNNRKCERILIEQQTFQSVN